MEKLLPIEAGCRALVNDPDFPENHMKEVIVISLIHENADVTPDLGKTFIVTNLWRVNKLMRTKAGFDVDYAVEYRLIRIDGYQQTEQEKQQELEHG